MARLAATACLAGSRGAGSRAHRWQLATICCAAAHNCLELAAGVGLILQRELGLPGATVLWGSVLPSLGSAARRGSARSDRMLAAVMGASLAGVTVHYTLWPSRRFVVLPVLTEAEGLDRRYLPAYNLLLLSWGTAAAVAVATEVRPRSYGWVALGFAGALPLRRHARRHFAWMHQQARVRPAWWNRAIARQGGRSGRADSP